MKIASLHQHFLVSSGISTDTRNILPNSIFFALKGANFNGNQFAAEALSQGANYVVVDEKTAIIPNDERYILVNNSLKTLQKLATFHRQFLGLSIIAITGSNGKTTTKELVNTVLSKKYKTKATKGNLNNHIGVPLTLLSMDEETEIGIVEMGANHPGEIEFLCNIAFPDYGYITNFGKAHLEGFGSIEGVIKAKSELYTHLKKHKKLIFLNQDDKNQKIHLPYNHYFSFGSKRTAKLKINYIEGDQFARINYNQTDFKSQLPGKYNAYNMAAALCIGLYFKVPFKEIQQAIEAYIPENNRSQVIKKENKTIYLDAYNANPTSMKASIENFSELKTPGQKMLILGDMLELGIYSEEEHQEIVNLVEISNFDETYLVGPNFGNTLVTKSTLIKFKNARTLKEHLKTIPIHNSNILVKGSRGLALEQLVDVI